MDLARKVGLELTPEGFIKHDRFRTNIPGITKKDRPLTAQHFAEFEKAYGKDPNGLSKRTDTGETGRFRKFHISEIKERGYKLDVTWLKDESLEENGTNACR